MPESSSGNAGPGDAGVPTTHDGGACLDISLIEEIADGRKPTDAEQAHLQTCPTCKESLRSVAANLDMLSRLRGLLGPDERQRPSTLTVESPRSRSFRSKKE